jgi:replication-associated recombination protein RarA
MSISGTLISRRSKPTLTAKQLATKKTIFNSLPWIEKYRPKRISSVSIDKQITKQINQMIVNKDIPNLILEGPPGGGKT